MRAGLILAGGSATRFGGFKALALFHGRPMVHWVASALQPLSEDLIVSVADHERAEQIREALPRARPVLDVGSNRGPIEGLARGLEAARSEIVLVAPCDAPLLRTELYQGLLTRLGDYDAAVPERGALDPVRAVYRREPCLRVLEEAGDRMSSPSALVSHLRFVVMTEGELRTVDPELRSFIDINTREELLALGRRRDKSAGVAPS